MQPWMNIIAALVGGNLLGAIPFRRLQGEVKMTLVDGRVVFGAP